MPRKRGRRSRTRRDVSRVRQRRSPERATAESLGRVRQERIRRSKKAPAAATGPGTYFRDDSERKYWLRYATGDGRTSVRPRRQKTAATRLSAGLVPALRDDAETTRRETGRRSCARKKSERRAVIMANGYGGRNGYKRRRKTICR